MPSFKNKLTEEEIKAAAVCIRAPKYLKEGIINMTNEQFIKELNRLEEKSILKHPFYQKWNGRN
jgi:hypothetical protein